MNPLAAHIQRLLAYHGWAYRRLVEALQALDDVGYHAPRGLFFDSLHGTLNHLAVCDRLWLARARQEPPPFDSLRHEVAKELGELAAFIDDGIAGWRALLNGHDDSTLPMPLVYRNVAGEEHARGLSDIVLHLVNHGTHHRGQMSAALTAMGQPAPVLDYLYYLPEHPVG
jgi:uncharacterized damage-inducible protein DinB